MKRLAPVCIKRTEGNGRIGTWRAFCGIIILALLSSGSVAHGMTFNVATDFSTTNNPNNVWSYGWSSTLTSAFHLYTDSGKFYPATNINTWGDLEHMASYSPNVAHNGTASPITFLTVTWQPGQLSLHPGSIGEYSHARWTAPYTGLFDIASTFTGIDFTAGTTTDVHVLKNGISLFDGSVNGYGRTSSFSRTIAMGPGDIIDFAVGYGSNHTYFNDSTALAATITVPEPATLSILALGGVALLRRRRVA